MRGGTCEITFKNSYYILACTLLPVKFALCTYLGIKKKVSNWPGDEKGGEARGTAGTSMASCLLGSPVNVWKARMP